MGVAPPRRPVTEFDVVIRRLRNGYLVEEAVEGTGYLEWKVNRWIKENTDWMDAWKEGASRRRSKWARREAERELECFCCGMHYQFQSFVEEEQA